jgi:hypothetical protein
METVNLDYIPGLAFVNLNMIVLLPVHQRDKFIKDIFPPIFVPNALDVDTELVTVLRSPERDSIAVKAIGVTLPVIDRIPLNFLKAPVICLFCIGA